MGYEKNLCEREMESLTRKEYWKYKIVHQSVVIECLLYLHSALDQLDQHFFVAGKQSTPLK